MLRKLWPYHLLYVAIAASLALAWGRIHKHSFYAHYFRTTQETGERNSQLIAGNQWVTYADVVSVPGMGGALLPQEGWLIAPPEPVAAPALPCPDLADRVAAHPFLAGAPSNGPPCASPRPAVDAA